MSMNRFAMACLSILAFGWVLVVWADDPPKADDSAKPKDDKSSDVIKKEAAENQEVLKRRFNDFEQSLLRLAQKLEKSSKPEDRQRADNLKKEIKRLMELIKQLQKVKREQQVARAKTEGGKLDKDALGKEQKKVSDDTEKIAKNMNKDGDGKGDKGKGDPKDGKD